MDGKKLNKNILRMIYHAIDEINSQLSDNQQLKKSEGTVLYGNEGNLDSLGLVNLLVIIEQNIEDEYDVSITIADEKAMSHKHSPFKTINSLADYIFTLLKSN